MTAPNIQPLRNLADQWKQLANAWTEPQGYAFAIKEASRELTEVLNNLVADACDCTAGVDHVHTGIVGKMDIDFDNPDWELHSCGEWKLATATKCVHCEIL